MRINGNLITIPVKQQTALLLQSAVDVHCFFLTDFTIWFRVVDIIIIIIIIIV
jgi:hypothetical protein